MKSGKPCSNSRRNDYASRTGFLLSHPREDPANRRAHRLDKDLACLPDRMLHEERLLRQNPLGPVGPRLRPSGE